MRCSSTAGFHGRSMLTTDAAACCRFSPTPPASVERNNAAVRVVAEAVDQLPRACSAARRRGTARGPSPRFAGGARCSSCMPQPLAEDDHLGVGSLEQLVEQRRQLVGLDAVVGLVVEQVGAVAGHAHVLQRASCRRWSASDRKPVPAPLRDDAGDDLPVLLVMLAAAAAVIGTKTFLSMRSGSWSSTSSLRRRSRIGASVSPMRSRSR